MFLVSLDACLETDYMIRFGECPQGSVGVVPRRERAGGDGGGAGENVNQGIRETTV